MLLAGNVLSSSWPFAIKTVVRILSYNFWGLNMPGKTKEELTPREQEVLSHLARGCTGKEIAQSLSISKKTVKSHLDLNAG